MLDLYVVKYVVAGAQQTLPDRWERSKGLRFHSSAVSSYPQTAGEGDRSIWHANFLLDGEPSEDLVAFASDLTCDFCAEIRKVVLRVRDDALRRALLRHLHEGDINVRCLTTPHVPLKASELYLPPPLEKPGALVVNRGGSFKIRLNLEADWVGCGSIEEFRSTIPLRSSKGADGASAAAAR